MADVQTLHEELAALKSAYRSGARVVQHGGRRVEYDSEAGLRRRIAAIEDELGAAAGKARPVARFAAFRRGG